MSKIDTSIDRKKEIAVAFANWINKFYVAVDLYGWVAIHSCGREAKIKSSEELYHEFLKKDWR